MNRYIYNLRTLLIVLALGPPVLCLLGCDSKARRVQQGIEDVGQHAKNVEDAASTSDK
jgi:hypothetical protein